MASVLVIDDEPAVCDILVRLLEKSGHHAVGAPSVPDALDYATAHQLDLVITDVFMPEHDGFEAIAEFRRLYPKVRVVAMSGGGSHRQKSVLHMARCLGAVTIEKPVSLASLNAVVNQVLDLAAAPSASASHRPFLPIAVAPAADVRATHARVMGTPMLVHTLDALPGMTLLLNKQRQTVYANRAALRHLGYDSLDEALGRRPGDLMHCVHAAADACGTTDSCRYCGAAQVQASALQGKTAEQECRINPETAGGELDLRVSAQPFMVGPDELLLLSVTDIADEKRREALEAMFFHDVLNTAGGIRGLTGLIRSATPAEAVPMQQTLETLSASLVDEIEQQRGLTQAERGELMIAVAPLNAQRVLESVAAHYSGHLVARGRTIEVEPEAETILFETDPVLIGRVLGNMLKNALEAVDAGTTVRVRAVRHGDRVRFEVWNPGCMPESAQKQVFQRSYSTKGASRGLGTYGMRLLTERYLGGRVWFESDKAQGTRFVAELPARLTA